MTSIGETLRRERLKRKLGLQDVSSELKISPRLLEAIEDEDFEKLPGGVFTRSFVRQYARLLGLDADEISGELQRVLEPAASSPHLTQVAPPIEPEIPLPRVEAWQNVGDKSQRWSKSLPAFAMVVAIMLVCSFFYSLWQRERRPGVAHGSAPAPVDTASNRPAPQAPQQQPATQPAAQPGAAPDASTAADRKKETAPETANSGQTTGTSQPNGASAPLTASNTAATVAPADAAVRVEMTADEPVWVSAHGDGKYLFSGTLQANESRTALAETTVVLRLGNAGGIHISLNGKPIGPIGPKGQIRTVQLTSGGFQIVLPEPKPDPPSDLAPL
jgi:cytoskeleton protein RodZ